MRTPGKRVCPKGTESSNLSSSASLETGHLQTKCTCCYNQSNNKSLAFWKLLLPLPLLPSLTRSSAVWCGVNRDGAFIDRLLLTRFCPKPRQTHTRGVSRRHPRPLDCLAAQPGGTRTFHAHDPPQHDTKVNVVPIKGLEAGFLHFVPVAWFDFWTLGTASAVLVFPTAILQDILMIKYLMWNNLWFH